MRTKTGQNGSADRHVKEIKRETRRKFSAEEKIRIVLDGLRGQRSISELCHCEGIAERLYYNWSKDFMEASNKRLAGDTARPVTSSEVADLKREAHDLKEVVAEQTLELRSLKKACSWMGTTLNEVPCIRKVGDHSVGRRVASASQTNLGQVVRVAPDFLSMICSVSSVWRGKP